MARVTITLYDDGNGRARMRIEADPPMSLRDEDIDKATTAQFLAMCAIAGIEGGMEGRATSEVVSWDDGSN